MRAWSATTRSSNFQPDILESFDVAEDRIFTFKLRDGHKWSDGSPLTPEDFRYCWEDVLAQRGAVARRLPPALLVDGKPPTLRDRRSADGPLHLGRAQSRLPAAARRRAAAHRWSCRPHYLKQFHKKYQDEDKLDGADEGEQGQELDARCTSAWRGSIARRIPTCRRSIPGATRTKPPAEQFVFERNPYFHRVDENGRQLPYIDRFILNVSSSSIIPAKTGAGESDLQAPASTSPTTPSSRRPRSAIR